jgi:hypothetical protein
MQRTPCLSLHESVAVFSVVCFLAFPVMAADPTATKADGFNEGKTIESNEEMQWVLWELLGNPADLCKDEPSARAWFESVDMALSNASGATIFSATIEAMAMDCPVSFLNAVAAMRRHERQVLVEQFIAKPKTHKPQEIEHSLSRYWTDRRYREIRKLYVKARANDF